MKFGYFTLTDNSAGYGAARRDPTQFLLEVAEECVEAEAMGYASACGCMRSLVERGGVAYEPFGQK